jgi:hypothetical protein
MAGPWEKYAQDTAADTTGPWDKYKGASAAPAQSAAKAAPLDQLPPEQGGGNQPTVNADGIAHRILGVGEAGLSAATGALGGAAGQVYGIGKTLASGKFGTQAGIQEGEKAGVELANKLTYQPRTQTGQNLVEGAGKALEASRLQGLPVEAGTLGRIGEVPRGALATGEGAADLAGKVGASAARGALAGPKAVGRAAVKALPDIEPETAALARDAHAMGFRLSPEQVYGNKYGKFAGELATENPFVKNNREHNQQVFNQQLVQQIGGTGDKLTRKTFGDATKKVGSGIGELNNKYDLPIDKSFVPQLRTEARGQSPEVANAVNYFAGRIAKETQGGNLNGTTFRRINTELNNRIKTTSNGDLKYALSNMQDKLLDLQQAQMSPADKTQLQTLRKQYAIQRTIEPLVAKSPTGDVSPAALLGAITSTKAGKAAAARGAAGDLGKLADIGQKFLKPNASSGTAERSFFQNLLTHPAGTLAAGATAAATAPVAAAYNRYAPSVTNQLISRPPQ